VERFCPLFAGETLRFRSAARSFAPLRRPWTRDFVQDLHRLLSPFHEQIQVNSAVRTVKIQRKLRRHNRNAAAEGHSFIHLAGLTVDLSAAA